MHRREEAARPFDVDPVVTETALLTLRIYREAAEAHAVARLAELKSAGEFELERFWRIVQVEIVHILSSVPTGSVQ